MTTVNGINKSANSANGGGMELHVDVRAMWLKIRSNWQILAVSAGIVMGFTGIYTFFFQMPTYRSTLILRFESTPRLAATSSIFENFSAGGEAISSKLQTYIDFFHSEDFSDLVVTDLATGHPDALKGLLETDAGMHVTADEMNLLKSGKFVSEARKSDISHAVAANLNISAGYNSSNLIINGESLDRNLAFELTEAAGRALLDSSYNSELGKMANSRRFLGVETKDLRDQLKTQETALVHFQNEHHILSATQAQVEIYESYLHNVEHADEIRRQITSNVALQDKIAQEIEDVRGKLTDPNLDLSNLYLSQLQHRREILQYQKALLANTASTPKGVEPASVSPASKTVDDELDAVSKEYRAALQQNERGHGSGVTPYEYYQALQKNQSDLKQMQTQLNSQLEVLKRDIAKQKPKVDALPVEMQNFGVLQRNIEMTSQLYLTSKKKYQELQFMEADIVNELSILVKPRVAENPTGMGVWRMFVYAMMVGLVLGIIAILLRDVLIHTVRGRQDFEESGVEFLSGIVAAELRASAPVKGPKLLTMIRSELDGLVKKSTPLLVFEELPESLCADNFRALRLKLLNVVNQGSRLEGADSGKVIMVSGPVSGCGKSFVAANLASAVAKADLKTLLIDLNLRDPHLAKFFPKVSAKGGVETCSHDASELNDLIVKAGPCLDVLLASHGANHPPDLLESKGFRAAIETLRKKYDLIIMDTPAILPTIDSSLISLIADAVVLVASYNNTFKEDVQISVDSLRISGQKPIFGVINFVDRDASQRVA